MKNTLKIVSDGTALGTHVFAADGSPIEMISRIDIGPILPNGLVNAALHFTNVALEVEATPAQPAEACITGSPQGV